MMRDHDLANYQKNWSKIYCPKIVWCVQWWILCEASEAVASGPPRFYSENLEITMKLGRKVENTRSIRSEDFFFSFFFLEITMILQKKIGKYVVEDLFFGEHQFLRILIGILPQAPNFKYPSLGAQL